MKKLLFFLSVIGVSAKAQVVREVGVGPEIIYNLPINEPGIGLRAHVHFTDYLFIAPQISYFPGLLHIHELYAGASLNLKFFYSKQWSPYLSAGGYYNAWLNFATFGVEDAQQNNFAFEGGAGITKNRGCWRPFLEYRIDSKWWESNLRLGILVYFGNCGKKQAYCPAYQ